jgi:hypothetical protein
MRLSTAGVKLVSFDLVSETHAVRLYLMKFIVPTLERGNDAKQRHPAGLVKKSLMHRYCIFMT